MGEIQFCEGSSSIPRLIKLLKGNEDSYMTLCDNWKLFGYSLGLTKDEIDGLREKLISGRTEIDDIPREVLVLWKNGHGEDANLKVFCEALMEAEVEDLADSIREEFGDGSDESVNRPTAKWSRRRMTPEESRNDSEESIKLDDDNDSDSVSDVSDDNDNDGAIAPEILRALQAGRSSTFIEELVENGANVNVKSRLRENTAHKVIWSLIENALDPKGAIEVLNLLLDGGFNLINDGNREGAAPLLFAMQYDGLNEELLSWFFKNGADFNAVYKDSRSSVLFMAVVRRQDLGIIRKIIEFGGDLKHTNKFKENALHAAAVSGYAPALEMLIDEYGMNVNEADERKLTPLHHLFSEDIFDYENCLEILIKKGANFGAKCDDGYAPLAYWIKPMKYTSASGKWIPIVLKMRDILPITEEIASAALTAIVEEMAGLENYLPFKNRFATNDLSQFISFLIEEKKAKLQLVNKRKWRQQNWRKLEMFVFASNFVKELSTTGRVKWSGDEFIKVDSKAIGKLDFHTKSSIITVPIETILVCLLACMMYAGFVKVCEFLNDFCESG